MRGLHASGIHSLSQGRLPLDVLIDPFLQEDLLSQVLADGLFLRWLHLKSSCFQNWRRVSDDRLVQGLFGTILVEILTRIDVSKRAPLGSSHRVVSS